MLQIFREQAFWRDQKGSITRVIEDIWDALQPGTTEKYCQLIRNFCQFSLMESGEIVFPVGINDAAKFLVYLRETGYSKFSIKLGLVSLKWANSFFPLASVLSDPFLERIVTSALKTVGAGRNQKAPFSKEMIAGLLDLGENPSLTQIQGALIPSLSFSLLLRNDELRHLGCNHIERRAEGLVFKIVSSKTDVFRKGKELFLAEQVGKISVSNLFNLYIMKGRLKIGENKFIFGVIKEDKKGEYVDGRSQLSYGKCLEIVRAAVKAQGVNPRNFGTHSARSGGASTLAPKVTPFELMMTGRWADARSLRNYVEVPDTRRFDISRNLHV